MSKLIHVAIASTTSKPGDVQGNLGQIAEFAQQAARDGADVLLTPEMSACGYGGYPEVVATAEKAGGGPIYAELANLAQSTGVVVCAGFVESAGDKRHLAHYAVLPDGKYAVQRKHRVTRAELPLDSPVKLVLQGNEVDPADRGQPVEVMFSYFHIKGVKCAIAICADSGIKNVNEIFASEKVELVLLPTGAGGKREDRVTSADLLTAAGREKYAKILEGVFFPGRAVTDCILYRRAMAAVNLCGYDGQNLYHVGHGTITNAMGEVLGFFHGIPNLDRQRPMYAHAVLDVSQTVNP